MRWWERISAWDKSHRLAVDTAGTLIVMLGAALIAGDGSIWTILAAAPLALRRIYPVASATAVYGVVLLHLLTNLTTFSLALGDALVLVALAAVTLHGPEWAHRTALFSGLAGDVLFGIAQSIAEGDSFRGLGLGVVAMITTIATYALALVRRTREDRIDALHERTRRLEAERDQQATVAAAAERARIARDMHDIVAHSLSVVVSQADGGRYAAAADPDAATRALATIAESGRAALADMRSLLGVLRTSETDAPTPELRPQPVVGEITDLVASVRESGLPVSLVHVGTPRTLPPGTGLTVFRVSQEALTNVLKHGGSSAKATVVLQWSAESLTLEVSDDGRGAASSDDGAGNGLRGMRERVAMLGGTISVGPRPGGGFRVRATIPLPRLRETAT